MNIFLRNITLVGATIFLVACGSNSAESGTDSTIVNTESRSQGDKHTGLSKDAVNAQLAEDIRSPYQLTQAYSGYAKSIIRTSYASSSEYNAALKEAIMDASSNIMPKASPEVKDEISDFLVKHYVKHGID